MEVLLRELRDYDIAPKIKGICREIGNYGEEFIHELLNERDIPHQMTDASCPVDFLIPARDAEYGMEVKVSLTGSDRVVLQYDRTVRRKKLAFCKERGLTPVTVLIKRIDNEAERFTVLWKPGIKRFVVSRMRDFQEFLDGFEMPRTIPFQSMVRCPECGRFVRHRLRPFLHNVDVDRTHYIRCEYKCSSGHGGILWRTYQGDQIC